MYRPRIHLYSVRSVRGFAASGVHSVEPSGIRGRSFGPPFPPRCIFALAENTQEIGGEELLRQRDRQLFWAWSKQRDHQRSLILRRCCGRILQSHTEGVHQKGNGDFCIERVAARSEACRVFLSPARDRVCCSYLDEAVSKCVHDRMCNGLNSHCFRMVGDSHQPYRSL